MKTNIELAKELRKMIRTNQLVTRRFLRVDELSPPELDEFRDLYDEFNPNAYPYKEGEIFQYNQKLYRVTSVGAVPSQEDWKPDLLPALYDPITPPGTIAPWEQRYGHNPYLVGDQVIWLDKVYTCIESTTYNPTDVPTAWAIEEEEEEEIDPVDPEEPVEEVADWEQRFGGNEYAGR